jgi:hypothetical protein
MWDAGVKETRQEKGKGQEGEEKGEEINEAQFVEGELI